MIAQKIRINKYCSLCGLGSRRKTEEIIKKGLIYINGHPMTDLSYQVDVANDIVMYKGRVITPVQQYHYLVLNKPKGYVTTTKDERNRPTVLQLIPEHYKAEGTFPVGRLDKDTQGLLLFTNDGELAYKLTHPRFKVPKTYQATLDRPLRDDHKIALEHGIELYGTYTLPATIIPVNDEWTIVTITITEGKKRQVRMMFAMLGYEVLDLIRIQYGPITLGNLPKGKYRVLSKQEIQKLKSAIN
ncbi:MAG: rRNA pseudouridine synthase [Spirochaetes bacterium]|nr:rRNA pseudouridine synthase [Spirochaetota bacterium]